MRELTFVCGVEGASLDNIAAIEKGILNTIQQVAEQGVPQEQVEAVLHQLELHQREVGGDGYPFGLQLILAAIGNATHRGDPIAVLNLDPVLEQLREDIKDPEFIKSLARKLLIDNPHRVSLTLSPDKQLSAVKDAAEATKLAAIKAAMDDQQKQQVIELANALNKRQMQKDDDSILPKVGLEDVPRDIRIVDGKTIDSSILPIHSYSQGTNGLVYQQIIIQLPPLDDELVALLPHYTNALTELGIGDKDYLATQAWQAKVCGSINAFTTMRGATDDEQKVGSYLVLSSKALARNHLQQAQLMQQTLHNIRFDELGRMRELVSQQRARREQSVTNNGHSLAMSAASSGMSPTAALSHKLSGLAGIQAIKALDIKLQNEEELKKYASQLNDIHQQILSAHKQQLLISDTDIISECEQTINDLWKNIPGPAQTQAYTPAPIRLSKKQVWVANTQVNFCAKAYPTVPVDHPDAAPLTILGGFLRNGYLHRAIREQGGAYGGGASHDANIAAFRFYSYRDPRIEETLSDFDKSIEWLLTEEHDEEQLEQAILGVISSLDKPSSPAGEAKQAFHNQLFGRSHQQRREFRQRILQVSIADLKRVTGQYLKPELASIAVVTNQTNCQQLSAFIKNQECEVLNV